MRAILTWHSIDESGSPISVSRADFARQLEWLAATGARVISLAELARLPGEEDGVAFTFDDGLANIAETALPLLEARGWPATIFAVTKRVGLDNRWDSRSSGGRPVFPLLDWEQLGRLAERGFEIGAHTRRHPMLPSCDAAQVVDELEGSAEDLERRLGKRPESLAYPYGAVNASVAAVAARTFRRACTTELRPLGREERAELLPRLDARYLRGPALRSRWGSPGLRRYIAWRRAFRAVRATVLP